jgi:Zn-dependent protease with chaperone function
MKFEVNEKEYSYLLIMSVISFWTYIFCFVLLLKSPKLFAYFSYYIFFFLIFGFVGSVFLVGYIKGNAVKISEKQFPDVFNILNKYSHALGLDKVPEMYVLQGNGVLNAFATRFARKNFVVLYSDVFELAYEGGLDDISFIIGHELGHIKRNHVSVFKSIFLLPARLVPFLGPAYSRACEYTCDNIGYNLAPNGAVRGLLILAAGKKLYKKIDVSALIDNDDHYGFASWVAEIFSTHPHLIKRLEVFNELNIEMLETKTFDFIIPDANFKNKEIQ